MVSVKYRNQIVTTLNPNFKQNDSILKEANKSLAKPNIAMLSKQNNTKSKSSDKLKTVSKP